MQRGYSVRSAALLCVAAVLAAPLVWFSVRPGMEEEFLWSAALLVPATGITLLLALGFSVWALRRGRRSPLQWAIAAAAALGLASPLIIIALG